MRSHTQTNQRSFIQGRKKWISASLGGEGGRGNQAKIGSLYVLYFYQIMCTAKFGCSPMGKTTQGILRKTVRLRKWISRISCHKAWNWYFSIAIQPPTVAVTNLTSSPPTLLKYLFVTSNKGKNISLLAFFMYWIHGIHPVLQACLAVGGTEIGISSPATLIYTVTFSVLSIINTN